MAFNQKQLSDLKIFIQVCQAKPDVLHLPDLHFFREYLESLGATIPELKHKTQETVHEEHPKEEEIKEEKKKKRILIMLIMLIILIILM